MGVSVSNAKQIERALQLTLANFVKDVAQITWEEARRATPIKTGNARKNWTKNVGDATFNVENRVPYIQALENNHSKQTRGKGIIMPALTQIKGRIK